MLSRKDANAMDDVFYHTVNQPVTICDRCAGACVAGVVDLSAGGLVVSRL